MPAIKPNNMLIRVGTPGKMKGSYMSYLPFIGFEVEMNERKMLLSFFTNSRRGTKRVPTTYKAQTSKATTYAGRFPGIALRDALQHALHAQPTCNGLQTTHSRERAYTERTTHTTVQFPTPIRRVLSDREPYATGRNPCLSRRVCLITRPPCRNDLSGDDRDGRAAATSMRKGYTVARCAR
jgi:hypothetical protein